MVKEISQKKNSGKRSPAEWNILMPPEIGS
jgi:hypothetical protein